MRWLHWMLAASLLFNGLALAGYFYARQHFVGNERAVRALALTPAQRGELRALRREALGQLVASRSERAAEFDSLVRAMREARPGSDRIEPALRDLAAARIPTQLRLARRLVAFRAQLDPEQQEAFNRMLGRRGFALALLGLLPRSPKALRGVHPES